jgi:hypothetical protein
VAGLASAGILTLGTPAGSFALPGGNAAPHTPAAVFRSFGWLQIV